MATLFASASASASSGMLFSSHTALTTRAHVVGVELHLLPPFLPSRRIVLDTVTKSQTRGNHSTGHTGSLRSSPSLVREVQSVRCETRIGDCSQSAKLPICLASLLAAAPWLHHQTSNIHLSQPTFVTVRSVYLSVCIYLSICLYICLSLCLTD